MHGRCTRAVLFDSFDSFYVNLVLPINRPSVTANGRLGPGRDVMTALSALILIRAMIKDFALEIS